MKYFKVIVSNGLESYPVYIWSPTLEVAKVRSKNWRVLEAKYFNKLYQEFYTEALHVLRRFNVIGNGFIKYLRQILKKEVLDHLFFYYGTLRSIALEGIIFPIRIFDQKKVKRFRLNIRMRLRSTLILVSHSVGRDY